MADFNIEEFLNAKFKKLEKKNESATNKVKPSDTATKSAKNNNVNIVSKNKNKEEKMDIDDYVFENNIDDQIYNKFNTTGSASKSDKTSLASILQPLFPNEKVYLNEFTSDKTFLLDKFITEKKKPEAHNLKINDTRTFIAQLKQDKSLNYTELYNSMHILWQGYIKSLLNGATQPDTIYSKMLKADLHGSIIEVVESVNSNQVGLTGLVVLETKRSFVVLNKDDKIKTILKQGSTFRIDLQYTAIKIIGDNFMYKAVQRTKAKYKNKYILNKKIKK
jgi:RNase P/RNase MRP subunit p29